MDVRLALSLVAVVGVAGVHAAVTPGPASAVLTATFGLSPGDVSNVDRGRVVTRTLDAKNSREVATLGVARIATTPLVYVEHLRDITAFKQTDDVLQIGTFGTRPRPEDLASLTFDDRDMKRLRECRVGDCGVRLPADAIERVRREIDWQAADAPDDAARLLRELFAGFALRYVERGNRAGMEYADSSPPLDVGREFVSLVEAESADVWRHAPRLRRRLLEYPALTSGPADDFLYWSKELVHNRPVVSITHVAIEPLADGSPVTHAIASKQIYATHYFDASLGLTFIVRDEAAPARAMYLVYLNRTRIDMFDGFLGGVARRIVAGRARGVVQQQLERLQRKFAGEAEPRPAPAAARATAW